MAEWAWPAVSHLFIGPRLHHVKVMCLQPHCPQRAVQRPRGSKYVNYTLYKDIILLIYHFGSWALTARAPCNNHRFCMTAMMSMCPLTTATLPQFQQSKSLVLYSQTARTFSWHCSLLSRHACSTIAYRHRQGHHSTTRGRPPSPHLHRTIIHR